jgi:hypothetical protein
MGKIIQDADRIYDIVEGCREKLAFLAEIVPVEDATIWLDMD